MGGGKSKSKKSGHPHEIRIRKGKSGGHIVTHHFQPDETGASPEPEEHVMPTQDALLDHIAQNTDNQAAPMPAQAANPAAGAGGAAPPTGM